MADVIIMPKLGQATEESTIVKWHKREGDAVKKGDILFEMETDKAVLEAESFFEGTLLKILVPEGVTIPVNVPVGYIGKPGEKIPDTPPPAAPTAAPAAKPQESGVRSQEPVKAQPAPSATSDQKSQMARPEPAKAPPRLAAPAAPAAPARLFISPRAKALVETKVIDPSPIRGSGPNGRITTKDVEAYLETHKYNNLKISPAAKNLAAKEKVDILSVKATGIGGRIMVADVERALKERPKAMSKMRQVIARRLTESFTTTPHFYVTVSIDMTDLFVYRKELKDRGDAYTVTDFILEAVILSLLEFPIVNSVTDGTTVKWHGSVDLGMAVSLDEGLVVPAIRNAEALTLKELHDTAKALADKARTGKLLPDEMTGTTFTVSNMGMMNVENFHAIINPGEGAILAVSSTIDTPVVKNGQIKVRSMMKITLSTDHRIVDGATGAAFVNSIRSKLEDVELWKSLT
jgi:pyruvate dehydrogenase E2 component (dihydrolipoamide acetyltransferase)